MKEETKCYCGHTTTCDCGPETLEEAINKYPLINQRIGFKLGAKWQQERSYSEEEVLNIILKYELAKRNKGIYWSDREAKEWFEQFKKK
jgi:hypothetical protein